MPRLLAILSGLALLSAIAPAAPVPKDAEKSSDYYFPTTVGAKWVYQATHRRDWIWTRVVTKAEAKGEARIVSIGEVGEGGEVSPLGDIEVSPRGLFPLRPTEVNDPPKCWLKLPLEANKTWEYDDRWHGGTVGVAAFGPEKVKVPAGTFRAIRVAFSWPITHNAGGGTTTMWLAPGVGEIKQSNDHWTRVLKSFTPGKP
jgi:hypothetical protein